jgi:hypothetical protein
MAQIPNIADLTINAEEVTDISQMIALKSYQDANYLRFHRLVDGISRKTQILLDATSGQAGWKATGCAAIASGGMDIRMAELFWDLVTIEDTLELCQNDLDSNFKLLVKKYSKDKFGDLTDQEAIKTFIYARVSQFIEEANERLIWLGDKDATNVADDGNIVDTIDPKFYTPLDGFWRQVMDSTTTPFTNIPANEQLTKALQLSTMDSTAAFNVVKGTYDKADDATKMDPDAFIWVTAQIYNQYKSYLAANTLSGGGLSEITINGIVKPAYMGVPVETSIFISKKILSDFEVGDGASPEVYTYDFPHRALMATPDLLPVATLNSEDIKGFESFYVQKDRKSNVRFDFDLDAKLVRPELVSAAY